MHLNAEDADSLFQICFAKALLTASNKLIIISVVPMLTFIIVELAKQSHPFICHKVSSIICDLLSCLWKHTDMPLASGELHIGRTLLHPYSWSKHTAISFLTRGQKEVILLGTERFIFS